MEKNGPPFPTGWQPAAIILGKRRPGVPFKQEPPEWKRMDVEEHTLFKSAFQLSPTGAPGWGVATALHRPLALPASGLHRQQQYSETNLPHVLAYPGNCWNQRLIRFLLWQTACRYIFLCQSGGRCWAGELGNTEWKWRGGPFWRDGEGELASWLTPSATAQSSLLRGCPGSNLPQQCPLVPLQLLRGHPKCLPFGLCQKASENTRLPRQLELLAELCAEDFPSPVIAILGELPSSHRLPRSA